MDKYTLTNADGSVTTFAVKRLKETTAVGDADVRCSLVFPSALGQSPGRVCLCTALCCVSACAPRSVASLFTTQG